MTNFFEKNPNHSLKKLLENSNTNLNQIINLNKTNNEEGKTNLYIEFYLYSERNFKQFIDKMNHSLGNYKANQSKNNFLIDLN